MIFWVLWCLSGRFCDFLAVFVFSGQFGFVRDLLGLLLPPPVGPPALPLRALVECITVCAAHSIDDGCPAFSALFCGQRVAFVERSPYAKGPGIVS